MPQLCGKIAYSKEALQKVIDGKEIVVHHKLDGERIMIHKVRDTVSVFSRNIAAVQPANYLTVLTPLMLKCVKAEECILDGELVCYNEELRSIVAFGQNKGAAIAEAADVDSHLHMFYVPFDIVYLRGSAALPADVAGGELLSLPLRRRLQVRHRVCTSARAAAAWRHGVCVCVCVRVCVACHT